MLVRLTPFADRIDSLNRMVARVARWALLANAVVISLNALARKLFAVAYPSAFDLQWHFFAAVVLLMAPYAMQRNEHMRIDILSPKLGPVRLAWIELAGSLTVLIPLCLLMAWISWPSFLQALIGGETRAARDSTSEIRAWIIMGLIPLGFLLLALQGASQAIRAAQVLRPAGQAGAQTDG